MTNTTLEMLLIAENPYGDVGGTNFASSLSQNQTLRILDIQNSRMSPEVEKQVRTELGKFFYQ